MGEDKHTKEPWDVEDIKFGVGYGINGRDGDAVVWWASDLEPNNGIPEGEDARRIVACVNACAGIPTEDLEAAAAQCTQWRRLDHLSDSAAFYANKEDQT